MWNQIIRSNFLIKLRSWEYWPFGIVQFPIIIYWLWLSLRARSFTFFSASNPGIPMGGMFGESKYDILKKIPSHNSLRFAFVKLPATVDSILQLVQEAGLSFPVIFKPDLGERGLMVRKVNSKRDVEKYLSEIKQDFIIQEFARLPVEMGIFYTRFPNQEKGKVTSVVMKEMLSVTGDGKKTLRQLIIEKDRAKLHWQTLKQKFNSDLNKIVEINQSIELVSIGNHCLGTMFLNGSHLINDTLHEVFDRLSKQIDGFYFGRFDLRCASIEELYKGNFKVMELNGCGAEPAHIYQPGFPLWKAIGLLLEHWKNIFLISRENNQRGIPYISFQEGRKFYRTFKQATNGQN
ncbi:MAG: hypothetical protein L0Y35_01160 [Flammeovirgaceae bacterium]|nr:hypothetical protein [Flammeovirgaceae bacterium]